jgi:hypothetical protein
MFSEKITQIEYQRRRDTSWVNIDLTHAPEMEFWCSVDTFFENVTPSESIINDPLCESILVYAEPIITLSIGIIGHPETFREIPAYDVRIPGRIPSIRARFDCSRVCQTCGGCGAVIVSSSPGNPEHGTIEQFSCSDCDGSGSITTLKT